ncbi:hypothetical protein BJY52DRAFT_1186589 [Lactarius psammicola]|nr:hypothetical protein BJY52DRAFT_1186589 [Lactarius psammicola]
MGIEERLRSLEDRLDSIELTARQFSAALKADVKAGFSSLQSRIDDFKTSIETSRQEWQANIEESIHKKLQKVGASLTDIQNALPVAEDDNSETKQTPITALNSHIQPSACFQHPEGQRDGESTITDRRGEATDLTIPTIAEERSMTPPSELMRGRDVVQPQNGVDRLCRLVQQADVLAEHLLKKSKTTVLKLLKMHLVPPHHLTRVIPTCCLVAKMGVLLSGLVPLWMLYRQEYLSLHDGPEDLPALRHYYNSWSRIDVSISLRLPRRRV